MRKRKLGLLSVVLAAAILLTGCASMIGEMAQKLGYGTAHYSDMEYTRPDVTAMKQIMAETCILASKETDPKNMMEGVYAFYEVYDSFYTNYFLANIRYSADLTDLYWEEEYNFCAENAAEADAALEEIYYALADSPIREELEQEKYFGKVCSSGQEQKPFCNQDNFCDDYDPPQKSQFLSANRLKDTEQ